MHARRVMSNYPSCVDIGSRFNNFTRYVQFMHRVWLMVFEEKGECEVTVKFRGAILKHRTSTINIVLYMLNYLRKKTVTNMVTQT